jgi:phage terminase large subunit-like protein
VPARIHPAQAPGLPRDSLLARAIAAVGVDAFLREVQSRPDVAALPFAWELHARPEQLPPPGAWTWWLLSGGRGSGKTRSGAEMARAWARRSDTRLGILGKTPDDVRRDLLDGPSGLMAITPPEERPTFAASVSGGELTWPSGAKAFLLSGAHPAGIRGVNLTHAWVDELPHFKYPRLAWDNLNFALRLGTHVQGVITTTPLAIKLMHELMQRDDLVYSRASTYANRANLAANFFSEVIAKYEGTRFGRQEIHGELLEDVPGALWKAGEFRYASVEASACSRIVVAIDPATTDDSGSDETGIVAAGQLEPAPGEPSTAARYAVLGDASLQGSPSEWARAAIALHDAVGAQAFVVETNQGGQMVAHTLRMEWQALGRPGLPLVIEVRASKGKRARAEPVAALYEQGRVAHVPGLEGLEDQLTGWSAKSGEASPDRLDALVWGLTELSTMPDAGDVPKEPPAPTRAPPLRRVGM